MGSNSTNRTGRVSSIDYERGTYEVTYTDRGKSVTRQINAQSNGEYKMPNIGQVVSVSHSSNGTAAAVTTGTVWNDSNKPAEGYKGLYRKEYGEKKGQAYERYDANTGVYTQFSPTRTGRNCNGEIFDEAKGPASIIAGGQIQLNSSKSSVGINAGQGVGINAETTVSLESGTSMSIESGSQLGISAGGKYSVTIEGETEEEYSDNVERKITGDLTEEITGEVTITVNGATITVSPSGDISIESPTKIDIKAPEINIDGTEVNITGGTGDAKIDSVSLVNHKHAGGPMPDK